MSQTLLRAAQGTVFAGLVSFGLAVQADTHQLYQASGMQTHQQHFQQALSKASSRYAAQLPAALADSLMRKSSERFAPDRMEARAMASLSINLSDQQLNDALQFYRSTLGQQIIAAETRATSPAEVSRMQDGVPAQNTSAARTALLSRLGKQLPALDMGEEVSLALASLATQSANDMLGGLLTIPDGLAGQGRGTLRAQMEPNLPQTLAYVYRDLSDQQLSDYADWSESDTGRAFFQAASAAARDALNP
ncbi:DUF2059 domain-containing protein [Halopseudomonas oceani]|uniref:DUF2059 domain-containing protein n=1 Tax=Halopseudomonas oceani TaxID=1708783 RepID=UPI002AA6A422|nr:DUF2059 domain-containing protein [Halopseudomonas oceani]